MPRETQADVEADRDELLDKVEELRDKAEELQDLADDVLSEYEPGEAEEEESEVGTGNEY